MPFNYPGLAKRVDKIIRQYGKAVAPAVLRRAGVDREVVALEADFRSQERDGNIVQMNDVRFLVSVINLTTPPDQEQDLFVVTHEGTETEYRIVSPPKRTAPGDTNIFWQLHCREM